eukprot:15482989-Alexandrium_andersonii.AAC.1
MHVPLPPLKRASARFPFVGWIAGAAVTVVTSDSDPPPIRGKREGGAEGNPRLPTEPERSQPRGGATVHAPPAKLY